MNTRRMLRKARYLLSARRSAGTIAEIIGRQRTELARTTTLVRVFYVAAAFGLVDDMRSWNDWAETTNLYYIWPVAWMDWVGLGAGIPLVLYFGICSTIAAFMWPQFRLIRLAAALGLLMQSALWSSIAGAIVAHGLHAWIWIAAWFVFLPNGTEDHVAASRARSLHYVRVFWCAQMTILFFYSLGGGFKCAAALVQAVSGEVHGFAPEALARHTAFRILEGAHVSAYAPFGDMLVRNPAWGLLIYPPTILLETLSFFVAFRPALHRAWAIALIGMHMGIYLVMTILFSGQVMMLGLLFLASPFVVKEPSLAEMIRQLPVLGDILAYLRERSPKTESVGTSRAAAMI